jgi:NodT family efflux transporter outer membrane factor (OMF) lipoprotein
MSDVFSHYGQCAAPRYRDTFVWCVRVGITQLVIAALTLGLTGCMVGPDFARPAIPRIHGAYSTTPPTVDSEVGDLACWWECINDPCLNELITDVTHQNLQLRDSYFRIVEARALAGAVSGRFFPTLNQKDSLSHRKNSKNSTQFGSPLTTPFNIYSLGFDSAWEIDLFGKIQRTQESAIARADATSEVWAALRLSLLAELATSYVDYRVIQERIRIAERNRDMQVQTLDLVNNRFANGLVPALEVAQAESNMYQTAATIPAARQQLIQTRNRICVLVGKAPEFGMDCVLGDGPIPEVPPGLAIGVPCDLVRRRPDVREAELNVASASADIGVATADLYPQLSLVGDISVDSRQYTNLFAKNSLAFSVGPSLRWKLFYWGSIRQNIESRKAAQEQAVARYQQTVLKAVEEVENGLITYQSQAEREEILEHAVDAARRSAQLSEARFSSGLITFLPVMDSQRELLLNEAELAESRGAKAIGLIQTYKAAGGGWGETLSRNHNGTELQEEPTVPDTSLLDSSEPETGQTSPIPQQDTLDENSDQ